MIQLGNGYSIKTDGAGCTLMLQEIRQKEEINKETKKKTGKLVDYTFKDEWNMLTVGQCLNRYLQLQLEDCEDVKGLMNKMIQVEETIKNLKV